MEGHEAHPNLEEQSAESVCWEVYLPAIFVSRSSCTQGTEIVILSVKMFK